MDTKYYDGTKLRNMMDLDGMVPEIYFSSSNRSAGKTTDFSKYFMRNFLRHNAKIVILKRYDYALSNGVKNFLKACQNAGYYERFTCDSKAYDKGKYYENFINGKSFGYTLSLGDPDYVKENSAYFADASAIFMDEVLSERGKYLKDEFQKFMSIHTSLARGGGKQKKYLPVYMLSNLVTMDNPYFRGWGICDKIPQGCKFFKWHGAVYEFGYNESAAKAQEDSGVMRAAQGLTDYMDYATQQGRFLADNLDMVEKKTGASHYWCTLKVGNNFYGVKIFDDGYMYVDDRPDMSYTVTIADKNSMDNKVYYSAYNTLVRKELIRFFGRGMVKFKNIVCKNAFLLFI